MMRIREAYKESREISKCVRGLYVSFYKKYWKETIVLSAISMVVGYFAGRLMANAFIPIPDTESTEEENA